MNTVPNTFSYDEHINKEFKAGSKKNLQFKYFDGCRNCNAKTVYDGCEVVMKWFMEQHPDFQKADLNTGKLIFECNDTCSCFVKTKKHCANRVSCFPRSDKTAIVFRTPDTGFGLATARICRINYHEGENTDRVFMEGVVTMETVLDHEAHAKLEHMFKRNSHLYAILKKKADLELIKMQPFVSTLPLEIKTLIEIKHIGTLWRNQINRYKPGRFNDVYLMMSTLIKSSKQVPRQTFNSNILMGVETAVLRQFMMAVKL
uniref:Uncharacterized protein n=1 Tax=Rhabditophanes sp. KR3021 TaxID=114890 RepID=A0AC35TVS3_9BILA